MCLGLRVIVCVRLNLFYNCYRGVTVMVVTAYMVDYVQVNRTLQNLNLEANQLGPKGVVPLAKALKVRQTAHLHMSLHHFSLFVS